MLNWLWYSSLVMTIVCTILLVTRTWRLKHLGTRTSYSLWLAVPLTLLLPLLPSFNLAGSLNLDMEVITISAAFLQSGPVATTDQQSYLVLFWLAGCLVICSSLVASYLLFKRQLQQARKISSNSLSCYQTDAIAGPAIFGLLKPSLILPTDFRCRFSQQQRRLILQHELCHWQRGDLHANLLAWLILIMFWFNPVLWLAYKRYRADQELACDADVLQQASPSQQFCYANALLAAMPSVLPLTMRNYLFCHHYGAKQQMKERLLHLKQQHGSSKLPALVMISLLLTTGLLWQQPLQAESPSIQEDHESRKPIIRINPRYPIAAAENRIEGYVQLQFNVEPDGSTSNIRVIAAQPEGVFEREAIRALSRWEYRPSPQQADNQDLKVQLDFIMD